MALVPGPVSRAAAVVVAALATGCSSAPAPPPPAAAASPTPAPSPAPSTAPNTAPAGPVADPALREELLAMLAADQAARAEEGADGFAGDRERTERLRRITAERGWPTRTLVGADGATAAWAIAQHSDLDPQVQERFLALMRDAVAAGEADPGELAYLEDRVAAGAGRPQTYGTQIGCAEDGTPQPGPLADPDRVDELRAGVGLPPLADYLAELAAVCAGS